MRWRPVKPAAQNSDPEAQWVDRITWGRVLQARSGGGREGGMGVGAGHVFLQSGVVGDRGAGSEGRAACPGVTTPSSVQW